VIFIDQFMNPVKWVDPFSKTVKLYFAI